MVSHVSLSIVELSGVDRDQRRPRRRPKRPPKTLGAADPWPPNTPMRMSHRQWWQQWCAAANMHACRACFALALMFWKRWQAPPVSRRSRAGQEIA